MSFTPPLSLPVVLGKRKSLISGQDDLKVSSVQRVFSIHTTNQEEMPYIPRRDRVNCLREFVLCHFSIEYLKSGPVLDVAGGKGDLSWFLRKRLALYLRQHIARTHALE